MSALHKEKPLTTADIANRQRVDSTRDDAAIHERNIDETNIDPADRRPPRPAIASSAARETVAANMAAENNAAKNNATDTYDGEIVNSRVDRVSSADRPSVNNANSVPRSTAPSGVGRETPKQPPAYASERQSTAAQSMATQTTAAAASQANGRHDSPLFAEDELRDFRARWDQVQTSFVDEPRRAVEQADMLVATVVKRIAEQFAEERAKLEKQWDRGDNVSTEDLRQGFKRYRAFFDRLLAF
jgi:hypothetical protein